MFEDAIANLTASGAIIGIAFDYNQLGKDSATLPESRVRHLVRLTPLGEDRPGHGTITSPEFSMDYSGSIRLFDDSGEIPPGTMVDWRALTSACWLIHGGLWAVMDEHSLHNIPGTLPSQ
ncbi:hypothetical protein KRM28CT15_25370 [Krasilnikovia sp. M28-CT-15]